MGIGDIANTGMQAAMSNMEVTSNNIANANTFGFKKSYINFADIYPSMIGAASNQIGMGVAVSSVIQDFSNGDPYATGQNFDLTINNNGFFILRNPNTGLMSYSRAGRFQSQNGYITYGNQRLQGFPAVNNSIPPGSTVSDIQISNASLPATASTKANIAVNLSSNSTAPTGTFDPTDSATYNYTSTVPIYDSLGNTHNVTTYYVKSASTPNSWDVYVYVDNTSVTATPGTATFNSNGVLTGTTGLTGLSFSPTTGATSPQTFSVNMTNSTQMSTPNGIIATSADGNAPAAFNNAYVDPNGIVWMQYTNSQTIMAGQVALANFQSPQALTDIGNMQWIANTNSGNPIINQSNSTNNITAGYVELSNVDLTTEMVNLISAQHTFQANAQVEQAYNDVMKTVIQL